MGCTGFGGGLIGKYSDVLPQPQDFDIKSKDFVIHENYTQKKVDGKLVVRNDIALIKLPKSAQFNQLVQPACWRNQSSNNDRHVVVGWGKTSLYQVTKNINGVYTNDQYKLEVGNLFEATQIVIIFSS